MEVRDSGGLPLHGGDYVAFNLSGAVTIGYIQSIGTEQRYGSTEPVLYVRMVRNAAGFKAGHVSRVRNLDGVCLIRNPYQRGGTHA